MFVNITFIVKKNLEIYLNNTKLLNSYKSSNQTLVLQNVALLDWKKSLRNYFLAIRDKKIVYVSEESPSKKVAPKGTIFLDAKNFLLTPGFWNAHGHLGLSYLRSMGHGEKHMIEDLFFKTEVHLTESHVENLCLADILTGINSGTVGFVDHYYFHRATARAVDKFGLRGMIADTLLDLGGPFPGRKGLDSFKKSVENWDFSKRVIPVLGPHATNTTSIEYFKEIAAFARSHKLKIHFHLSQTKREFEDCKKQHGLTPIAYLHSHGILGPDCLVVHVIHLEENDYKILRDTGCTVGFCPSSQILFEKLAPIHKFIEYEIPFVIGTDDAASNDFADMHQETKLACLLARDRGASTGGIAQRFFKAATYEAPRFFGIQSGVFEVGAAADFAVYLLDAESYPREFPYESFIFSMNATKHRATMIDGIWRRNPQGPLKTGLPALSKRYVQSVKALLLKSKAVK